ncbi:hypothetical protein VTH82DRAFT_3642 [Thermothelomyces myriococcoides]
MGSEMLEAGFASQSRDPAFKHTPHRVGLFVFGSPLRNSVADEASACRIWKLAFPGLPLATVSWGRSDVRPWLLRLGGSANEGIVREEGENRRRTSPENTETA